MRGRQAQNLAGRPEDGRIRRALSVAVSSFRPSPLPDLRYERQTAALRQALGALGYEVAPVDDPSAKGIGERVTAFLTSTQARDFVRVVHVLSHADRDELGTLQVLGRGGEVADDLRNLGTDLKGWVKAAAKHDALTLFLFDVCDAGELTRLGWRSATEERRAWVLAAGRPRAPMGPPQLAYNAWLTQAAAHVLQQVAAGELDLVGTYATLSTVILKIRKEVFQYSASDEYPRQRTSFSTIDPADAEQLDQLPFLPMPPRRLAMQLNAGSRAGLDPAAQPYLDALDSLRHFERASLGLPTGLAPREPDQPSYFTGRQAELRDLRAWLAGESGVDDNLRAVMAGPGTGKSALLGIVVAAAHPRLRVHAKLPPDLPADCIPDAIPRIAAVHARNRHVDAIRQSVVGQLGLDHGAAASDDALLSALADLDGPATIVVDALDEASDAAALHGLLLRMTNERRRGEPVCRLLVAARPWPQFNDLRVAAQSRGGRGGDRRLPGLVDLDTTDPAESKRMVRAYVLRLLEGSDRPDVPGDREVRRAIADAIAEQLADPAARAREGGALLVAGMFTDHLLASQKRFSDPAKAAAYAATVPTSLEGVFELHLGTTLNHRWARPVLATVAHSLGDGMPLALIHAVCAAAGEAGPGGAPSDSDISDVLEQARFYLRPSVDIDGSALYRLFHQGLTDYLRARYPVRPAGMAEALRATAGLDDKPRWEVAEPYVLRHLADHAVGTPVLDTLLSDPDFLIHAEPSGLSRASNEARSPAAHVLTAAYRTSQHRHSDLRGDPQARRNLLALDALRLGESSTAERIVTTPAGDPATRWRPTWATGGQATPALRHTLTGHDGPVSAVACFRFAHRWVAVTAGSRDRSAKVWDLRTGELRQSLGGHSGALSAVAGLDLGDGGAMAVTASDRFAFTWDLGTRQRIHPLEHDDEVLAAVCFRTPRAVVATASADGTARVWDAGTGARLYTLHAHGGPVTALACHEVEDRSPVLVTGGSDGARVWSLADGKPIGDLSRTHTHVVACHRSSGGSIVVTGDDAGARVWALGTHTPMWTLDSEPVTTVAPHLLANGQSVVVTAGASGTARVWGVQDGRERCVLRGHASAITAIICMRLADRTDVAITASEDGTARVFDLQDGRLYQTLAGHNDSVLALAGHMLDDGSTIVITTSQDTTARTWNVDARAAHTVTGHTEAVTGVVVPVEVGIKPAIAVTVSEDRTAQVRSLADGSPQVVLEGHGGPLRAVAWSRIVEGPLVAVTAGEDRVARLWDLDTGALMHEFPGHRREIVSVTCQKVDDHLTLAITASRDGTARVWELERRVLRRVLESQHGGVLAVASCALPGGRSAAVTAHAAAAVCVWDLTNATRPPRRLSGHRGEVRAVACHRRPNGTVVAVTGGEDGIVRIWDVDSGRRLHACAGSGKAILAVACCQLDDRTSVAVAVGDDGTPLVWDLATGRRLRALSGHRDRITTVASQRLDDGVPVAVTGSDDGTARVWDLRSGENLAVLPCQSPVQRVALAPDGTIIVAFDWDIACYEYRAG